ncbi:DNA polymerase IV, partial [Xylophilus sp. Kf1]|nr:DNA polymerase IV [Xylophilus sp. Kf1]
MDYFFAQVEMRDNPKLKGKPVIVGGKASHRGVVSTASYEARAYGVHSAMPMTQAHKLCPNGYYVTSRFDTYREVSGQIMKIFRSYTELVEPTSLDEAYLAKLASGMNKPNGLTVIDYNNVHEILMQLDIGDFPGVGKASKKKMHQHHIYTGQDLYNKDEFELIRLFGKRGRGL